MNRSLRKDTDASSDQKRVHQKEQHRNAKELIRDEKWKLPSKAITGEEHTLTYEGDEPSQFETFDPIEPRLHSAKADASRQRSGGRR
jgi:hypothetical protein